ncbi:MAG: hypothetical protein IJY42_03955 [Clostridia bacterium]|nr:hypothetical protein [Clostridia bacterium]
MKEYCIGLLASCFFCGICGWMAPDGSLRRYLRLVGGICILCVMLSPVPTWIRSFQGVSWLDVIPPEEMSSNYDEIYKEALEALSASELEAYVEARLWEQFSLEEHELELQILWSEEPSSPYVEQGWIILRDSAVFCNPDEVLAAAISLLECDYEILYD